MAYIIRPRLHRARCFSRRGLVLFLIFYKSSIFFIKTRVKQSSSCSSRELFKIKGGYTAVFHDNLAITQRKKSAWKTASGEKSDFFKREFYNNELHLSLFDTMYFTKLFLKSLRETGENLDFSAFLLLFAPM